MRLRQPPDVEAWGQAPTVLISHFPALSLATPITASGFPYPGDLIDRQELEDRLTARAAPTVVMSGHVHARAADARGCVLQLTCGAMVEPPYECAVIDVDRADGGTVTVHRQSIRLGEPEPPRAGPLSRRGAVELRRNVLDPDFARGRVRLGRVRLASRQTVHPKLPNPASVLHASRTLRTRSR